MNPKTILVPVLTVAGIALAIYMIYRLKFSSPGEDKKAMEGALGGGSSPSGTEVPPVTPGTETGGSNPSTTPEGGVVSGAQEAANEVEGKAEDAKKTVT